MLTGLVEKGRNKCELYFPLGRKNDNPQETSYLYIKTTKLQDKFTFDSKNMQQYEELIVKFEEMNEVTYGKYKIKYLKEEEVGECTLRHLRLTKSDSESEETRLVYHYWYSNWQDHKMANPKDVLRIAMHVLDANNVDNNFRQKNGVENKTQVCPVIVHCSAGIGRTGCFLAILNGMQQLRSTLNVDVLAILCSLRLNRGGLVQTAEQYELVHRVLSLYSDLM